MCWACDHPDASHAEFLDHVRGLIDQHGWAIQGVERDRLRPPWAYTTGLTAYGKPELVVTGMPLSRAAPLLSDVADYVIHSAVPGPGEQVEVCGGPLIEVVEVAVPTAHLDTAVDLYGPQIRAIQLVHADDRGHWPWDRWYRGVRGGQPVLGIRAGRPVAQPGVG